MDLGPLLNAHAYLRVERPPLLWGADIDDEALVHVLGEMIVAALTRGTELGDVVLRANNVTVEPDPDEELVVPAPGDYIALSIIGAGSWHPEISWCPAESDTPLLLSPTVDAASRAAGIPYAYTRSDAAGGSVTILLPREG